MEISSHKIKNVNSHIITDDEQLLLIDTGSPLSFHKLGRIILGGEEISVPTSIMGVTDDYLTQKVGCEVKGIIGLDVINKYPTLISIKDNILIINDDAEYSTKLRQAMPGNAIGGIICVEMCINGRDARMLVDTGAKISYIKDEFVAGLELKEMADDFSPYIGDFKTPIYSCKTELLLADGSVHHTYMQDFGKMPQMVRMTIEMIKMDGIIGFDLFKRFRLQLKHGEIYLPPQVV